MTKRTIGELAILAAVVLLAILAVTVGPLRAIPSCAEDVVLVGAGDFEGGRWDRLECGPALDDLQP